jgi:hypothetical protein
MIAARMPTFFFRVIHYLEEPLCHRADCPLWFREQPSAVIGNGFHYGLADSLKASARSV